LNPGEGNGKNLKQNIRRRLREIEVHRSHGLFAEAREICRKLADTIRKSTGLKNKKRLMDMVSQKIRDLEHDIRAFERAGAALQMPQTEEDITKTLFRLSTENKDDSAIVAGAEALLVFGQFEMALAEFNKLVGEDAPKVSVAKNILRCHIGLSAQNDAVSQYLQWFSSGRFSPEELGKIHYFLKEALGKKKMELRLPEPDSLTYAEEGDAEEEAFIDVLSILIPRDDTSQEGDGINLDVNFQRGNMTSVIVPQKDRAILESMTVGSMLNDVMVFSPAVIFKESCMVSETKQIKSGPKKGDYTLVIKMI
jgi:tetratricopeptide (TPR) repeat protein